MKHNIISCLGQLNLNSAAFFILIDIVISEVLVDHPLELLWIANIACVVDPRVIRIELFRFVIHLVTPVVLNSELELTRRDDIGLVKVEVWLKCRLVSFFVKFKSVTYELIVIGEAIILYQQIVTMCSICNE